MQLNSESIFIKTPDNGNLHIKRIYSEKSLPAIMCLHGSYDSGRIFYNKKLSRGLAPFLASNFDVYVPDLRGHGESTPPVDKSSEYGMHENIREDIPLIIKKISELKEGGPISFIGHSDGSVLFYSSLAYFKGFDGKIDKMVSIASKRAIRVVSLKKILAIDLIWYKFMPIIINALGYLPAKKLKIGSQDDSINYNKQRLVWLKGNPWIDSVDNFDYKKALSEFKVPDGLFLAAPQDPFSGHKTDVKKFMEEIGNQSDQFFVISKENGHLNDYNHVSIMIHRDCYKDHFSKILAWLNK